MANADDQTRETGTEAERAEEAGGGGDENRGWTRGIKGRGVSGGCASGSLLPTPGQAYDGSLRVSSERHGQSDP
jgi:hypothetical protein